MAVFLYSIIDILDQLNLINVCVFTRIFTKRQSNFKMDIV